MSAGNDEIVCRRCREEIPTEVENCPHCGAGKVDRRYHVVGIVVGLGLFLGSLTEFGRLWMFGLIGFIVAFGGAYFIWDHRRRLERASSTPDGT